LSDDELGNSVECNYTKRDTRDDAYNVGFLFYDEREGEREEKKLIKCVRICVGHFKTNKCVYIQ
jgi:hypothetical protein